MSFLQKYIIKPKQEHDALLEEIRRTEGQLRAARMWFESEKDNDLIDSCVYELRALEAKYCYLIKAARSRGLSSETFTA